MTRDYNVEVLKGFFYYFEECFITHFDFKNQSKLSAFTSITAQIKLCDSDHVSQTLKFESYVHSGAAMPRIIVHTFIMNLTIEKSSTTNFLVC